MNTGAIMRFYDREEELEILERNRTMSAKGSVFTVITGRRRIGKTALLDQSKKGDMLYVFVSRVNESTLCQYFVKNAQMDLGIELTDSGKFRDIFRQLMEYGVDNNYTLVIDEFQELETIDRSIMSSIQELWDRYKQKTKINLIVCGSLYSMMIKIFENNKEPLFGRATSKINIGPFVTAVTKKILKDHNPDYKNEDLLFLYAVTGGVPKYVELLMDTGAISMEKMLDRICSRDSLFLTDGRELLISEFGKDHMTYFSILQMIANGKNSQKEINVLTGKDCGAYLENMEKKYGILKKNRPLFSGENSRDVRWRISDNYLRFYFRFISSNMSAVELKRFDLIRGDIVAGFNEYSGKVLEDYFMTKAGEEEHFTSIGSYWDRRGENEIDLIVLNDRNNKAIVAEIKRNPKKQNIGELRKKTETVRGLNGYDIEYRMLSTDDM
jgi:AAA+ ATPase superfamily predicted ATPase